MLLFFLALTFAGCADSTQFAEGSAGVWSLEECQRPGSATGTVVDAERQDGTSNLTSTVSGYAQDRAGAVVLFVGEPVRVSVP